jgi:hypothetical protein
MKEIDIVKIIEKNEKLLFLMGVMWYEIRKLSRDLPESEKISCKWIDDAIYNVVYLDKPLPNMPD